MASCAKLAAMSPTRHWERSGWPTVIGMSDGARAAADMTSSPGVGCGVRRPRALRSTPTAVSQTAGMLGRTAHRKEGRAVGVHGCGLEGAGARRDAVPEDPD